MANQSDARKRAEALFSGSQKAPAEPEAAEDARRREAREQSARQRSLRLEKEAAGQDGKK